MEIEVGCDISMDWIDVCVLEPPRHFRVANKPKPVERLARELPPGSRIGMEATGTMHQLLADALCAAGHTVYELNPRWVHRYAGGVGVRGKSDRGDAMVIARYVHAEGAHLHPYRSPTPQQREIRTLLHRRAQVMKLKTASRQSLGDQANEVVQTFKQLVKDIDRRIATLLGADPQWKGLAAKLRRIPGVGPLVAAHLVEALARRPFEAVKAFIAYTGMDPRPNDSGRKKGIRRLTHHGDAHLRAALFMGAMAACKVARWRAVYEHNRRKGLPSTAAIIVVARKLARVAFCLFKTGQDYDPERIGGVAPT